MRRVLSPVPIAIVCVLVALFALLAYGLVQNEPDRGVDEALARGGMVLGVDMLDVTADAQEFIAEYKLTYPMLKDKDGEGLEKFGVVQYPETFVIDRQGRIAAVQRGPVDENFMQTKVEPLL